MKLLITAALLSAFSTALLGPVSTWLSRASWVERTPRATVLLWQCIGMGAIFSGIGAGLMLAVSRYRVGFAAGTRQLFDGVFSGHPLRGLGLYDALGLTLAADLLIVLGVVLGSVTFQTVRLRARHRELLDLVAHVTPEYPGTEFLADDRAIAYCLPGLRPRIVLSEGTRTLLGDDEMWAVIHHERGHAHERHGLVMFPMLGLRKALGFVPYARYASASIAQLLEMSADDFSARQSSRRTLASALVRMASTGWAPSCGFAATGSNVHTRVLRLLRVDASSKRFSAFALGLGVGVLLVPVSAALLV